MNIIDELWYGNISPCERDFKKGSKYSELLGYIVRHEEDLKKRLNDEEIEILEKFTECTNEMYGIADPEAACVTNAKIQAGVAAKLLCDGGALAKKVIAEANVPYASKEEFFRAVAAVSYEGEGVIYREDGSVSLHYKAQR